jgi:crossover junction endodeoxyribonuclease RuvC
LQKLPKIILGIDPGTLIMGYGIIEVRGEKISLLEMDVLKLNRKKHAHERLEMIYASVSSIITKFQPTAFAIEAPFFGKNVQSMLKLGRAQGVAIAAAMQAQIPVTEYSPKKIKQSITGNGNAAKEQVWKMLQRLTNLTEEPEYLDATDALAVAVCHHFQSNAIPLTGGSTAKGWADFLKNNPDRLVK